MSNCSVPANQPIYQALIDKAASYPADKPYQAKAYKKAAEIVAAHTSNIYSEFAKYCAFETTPAGIGYSIEDFIYEFIKANPEPVAAPKPVEPTITFVADFPAGAAKAMDDARTAAAAAAPKDVTTWPKNDDAERAAFQQKLAASKAAETPKTLLDFYNQILESQKPVIYTAENPRRSKRNIGKPTPKYFDEDDEIAEDSDDEYIDEEDEIVEAIKTVCAKKGYKFSKDLITDFNAWFPTADKYILEKYDYKTDKYIPRTKPEIAKQWAMYYSKSIQEQQKIKRFSKVIVKYCDKNSIVYDPIMDKKFSEWKADPANKNLITSSYTSYGYGGCTCSGCDPTGERKKAAAAKTETTYYERTPAYCVKQWFSTLKKTIVF